MRGGTRTRRSLPSSATSTNDRPQHTARPWASRTTMTGLCWPCSQSDAQRRAWAPGSRIRRCAYVLTSALHSRVSVPRIVSSSPVSCALCMSMPLALPWLTCSPKRRDGPLGDGVVASIEALSGGQRSLQGKPRLPWQARVQPCFRLVRNEHSVQRDLVRTSSLARHVSRGRRLLRGGPGVDPFW